MKYEPGLTEINDIVTLSDELESMRIGENTFNLDDLSLWTRKAAKLADLANEVKAYMRDMQSEERKADVKAQEDQLELHFEHEIDVEHSLGLAKHYDAVSEKKDFNTIPWEADYASNR